MPCQRPQSTSLPPSPLPPLSPLAITYSTPQLFLNDGSGTFTSPIAITSGTSTSNQPQQSLLLDLDNDNDVDIAVTSSSDDKLNIFLNDGSGGFSYSSTVTSSADKAHSVAAGDLDGDNDPDLALTSLGDSTLALFFNDGSAGFTPGPVLSTTLSDGISVIIEDMDGDGNLDVVAGEGTLAANPRVLAWYGDGSGAFVEDLLWTFPPPPGWVAGVYNLRAGDLDGDGDGDLFVGCSEGARVYMNDNGTFGEPYDVEGVYGETRVAMGDYDNDGDLDMVYSVTYDELSFAPNLGDGTFVSSRMLWPAPYTGSGFPPPDKEPIWVELADVDGDNALDLVVAFFQHDRVGIIPQRKTIPDPPFSEAIPLVTKSNLGGANPTTGFVVGFVDADLDQDIVVRQYGHIGWIRADRYERTSTAFTISASQFGYSSLRMLPDIAADNLVVTIVYIELVDYDQDGDADVGVLFVVGTQLRAGLYTNTDGQGTFSDFVQTQVFAAPLSGPHTSSIPGLADIDGDGDEDILVKTSVFHAWINRTGAFEFDASAPFHVVATPPNPIAGDMAPSYVDMDGDGDLDLVSGHYVVLPGAIYEEYVVWYANDGTGSFGPPITIAQDDIIDPAAVHSFDIDGDGDYDVVGSGTLDNALFGWWENLDGTGTSWGPVTLVDVQGSNAHVTDFIFVRDPDGRTLLYAYHKTAKTVLRWRFDPTTGGFVPSAHPMVFASASSVTFGIADVDSDTDGDLVVHTTNAAEQSWALSWHASMSRTGSTDYQPQSIALPKTKACSGPGVVPASCLHQAFGTAFACVPLVLDLSDAPPLGCFGDSALVIERQVEIVSSGNKVDFDCSATAANDLDGLGSVLFRIRESPTMEARVGAVTLRNVTIVGTGMARASVYGAQGLRVEGALSTLTLEDVTLSGAVSTPRSTFPHFDTGIGAAILAADGASLSLTNSRVLGSSASLAGGALAVIRGASLVASGLHIQDCQATDGGAIYAGANADLDISGATVQSCHAATSGGALFLSGENARVSLTDATLSSNTAVSGPGGAIFIASDSPLSSLVLSSVALVSNTAGTGGGGLASTEPSTLIHLAAAAPGETLAATSFVGNKALVGASLALASRASTLSPLSSTGGVPRSPESASGMTSGVLLLDDPGVEMDAAKASDASFRGGDVFVCDVHINVSSSHPSLPDFGPSFSTFACALPPSASTGETPPPPGMWFGPEDSVFRNAPHKTTPPVSLAVDQASIPPTVLSSGVQLGSGNLIVFDGYGQTVAADASVLARVSVSDTAVNQGVRLATPDTGSVLNPVSARISLAAYTLVAPLGVLQTTSASGLDLELDVVLEGPASAVPPSIQIPLKLSLCQPGLGAIVGLDPSVLECALCSPGSESVGLSSSPCSPVPQCPDNSDLVVNATAGSSCLCRPGFWDPDRRESPTRCSDCPTGGICLGGKAVPVAASGFAPHPSIPYTFNRCKRKEACLGGPAGATTEAGARAQNCATGYTGYMCNTCAEGYFSDALRNCERCPALVFGTTAIGFGVLVLISVGAGAAVVAASTRLSSKVSSVGVDTGREEEGTEEGEAVAARMEAFRMRALPASVPLVVVAFQVLSLMSDARWAWSDASEAVLASFGVFNVDTSLFANECTFDSFHAKYVVSMVLPVFVLSVASAYVVSLKVLGTTRVRAGTVPSLTDPSRLVRLAAVPMLHLLDATVFLVAPLLYIPMARATFVLFDCSVLPTGEWVLDADYGVACFDGAWWRVAPLGVAGLVCYVLGIPLYFMWCLWRSRGRLRSQAALRRYGSLYKLFRLPYFWGGVADLGKRLVLVVVGVFLSDYQLAQIGLLLVVFGTTALAVRSIEPYYAPIYNTLDVRLTLLLSIILLLGGASYAERSSDPGPALHIALLIAVALLLAVSVTAIGTDLWQIFSSRRSQSRAGYSTSRARAQRLAAALLRHEADLGSHAVRASASLRHILLEKDDQGEVFAGAGDMELDLLGSGTDLSASASSVLSSSSDHHPRARPNTTHA